MKKNVKWAGLLNRYQSLGISSDRPEEAPGGPTESQNKNRLSQTEVADFCFAMGLRVAGGLGLRDRGSGTKGRRRPGTT